MTIPKSVAMEDKRLQSEVGKASTTQKNAQMRLDAYRWEQCSCPDGPKYGVTEYAEFVGVTPPSISNSLSAWASGAGAGACTLGAAHPREAEQPSAESVNTGERTSEDHAKERTKARVGVEKAALVAAMSGISGFAESTITHNTAAWGQWLNMGMVLVASGKSVEEAAYRACAAKNDDREAKSALKKLAKSLLKQHNLNHTPHDVDALMGSLDTWTESAVRAAVMVEIKRDLAGKKFEQTRKENEAKTGERSPWILEIIAVAVDMAEAGEKAKEKIVGDPNSIKWDEDSLSILSEEIDRVKMTLEWLTALPTMSALTPEMFGSSK